VILISRRNFALVVRGSSGLPSINSLLACLSLQFVNVAREGLHAKTIFGSERTNRFLLETTGCGCAFY
jgi:hypothetical protein